MCIDADLHPVRKEIATAAVAHTQWKLFITSHIIDLTTMFGRYYNYSSNKSQMTHDYLWTSNAYAR